MRSVLPSIRLHPGLGLTLSALRPKCICLLHPRAISIRMMSVCPVRQPQEKPVLRFKVGEVVERREWSHTMRGTVVDVTANGYVVTVQWYGWLGLQGAESAHHSNELVRVSD